MTFSVGMRWCKITSGSLNIFYGNISTFYRCTYSRKRHQLMKRTICGKRLAVINNDISSATLYPHDIFEITLWWNNGGSGATEDFSRNVMENISHNILPLLYFLFSKKWWKETATNRENRVCKNSMKNENPICSLTLSRQASAKIVFSMPVKAREYHEYEPLLLRYFAFPREYIISFRRTHEPRKRKGERLKVRKRVQETISQMDLSLFAVKRTVTVSW